MSAGRSHLTLIVKENEQIMASHKVGSKQFHSLPAGQFEFIVGHEKTLGKYLSCSLFLPVFEFADQETAMQTAQEILQQVTSPGDDEAADEQIPKEISQRELLRSLKKSEPENTPEHQS